MAATANYLAADRVDMMYAAKEICRGMAKPEGEEITKMKRFARYLKGSGSLVTKYAWQGDESRILAYTDSDWAGCRTACKSNRGGVIMVGDQFIKG